MTIEPWDVGAGVGKEKFGVVCVIDRFNGEGYRIPYASRFFEKMAGKVDFSTRRVA